MIRGDDDQAPDTYALSGESHDNNDENENENENEHEDEDDEEARIEALRSRIRNRRRRRRRASSVESRPDGRIRTTNYLFGNYLCMQLRKLYHSVAFRRMLAVLLGCLLVSWLVIIIAALSDKDSMLYVYVILCGDLRGYTIAVLFLCLIVLLAKAMVAVLLRCCCFRTGCVYRCCNRLTQQLRNQSGCYCCSSTKNEDTTDSINETSHVVESLGHDQHKRQAQQDHTHAHAHAHAHNENSSDAGGIDDLNGLRDTYDHVHDRDIQSQSQSQPSLSRGQVHPTPRDNLVEEEEEEQEQERLDFARRYPRCGRKCAPPLHHTYADTICAAIVYLLLTILLVFPLQRTHHLDGPPVSFPSKNNFKFGVSTSSYQVEGGIFNNQWAEFEKQEDEDGKPVIENGDRCGDAADVWNHFEEDLDRARWLGVKSFRIGIEWARIEPQHGSFDKEAMDKYVEWCRLLRNHDIEPIVTLFHFTEPIWFERLGAFTNDTAPTLIEGYTRYVVKNLRKLVDTWITVNEPKVFSSNGWLLGEFPPGEKGEIVEEAKVVSNLHRAHEHMYKIIHELDRNISVASGDDGDDGDENDDSGGDDDGKTRVSIAKSIVIFQSLWSDVLGMLVASLSDLYWNKSHLRYLQKHQNGGKGTLDFIGINSYFQMSVGFMGSSVGFVKGESEQSDMGWDLDPQSLHRAVRRCHEIAPDVDLLVTEHGIADGNATDYRREKFLKDSLRALAIELRDHDDLPMRGYNHWSLIDNFEWAKGFRPKFGLYTIDLPSNQTRVLTRGGKLYSEIIQSWEV